MLANLTGFYLDLQICNLPPRTGNNSLYPCLGDPLDLHRLHPCHMATKKCWQKPYWFLFDLQISNLLPNRNMNYIYSENVKFSSDFLDSIMLRLVEFRSAHVITCCNLTSARWYIHWRQTTYCLEILTIPVLRSYQQFAISRSCWDQFLMKRETSTQ